VSATLETDLAGGRAVWTDGEEARRPPLGDARLRGWQAPGQRFWYQAGSTGKVRLAAGPEGDGSPASAQEPCSPRTLGSEQQKAPGHVEVDLVVHDEGLPLGPRPDPETYRYGHGWTELRSVQDKAQEWVFPALHVAVRQLPSTPGTNAGSGRESIDYNLRRWCLQQKIALNAQLRLPFYPSRKLIEKVRIGSRMRGRYGASRTPYQRLMDSRGLARGGIPPTRRARKEGIRARPVRPICEATQDYRAADPAPSRASPVAEGRPRLPRVAAGTP